MSFTNAAQTVIARLFRLLSTAGEVIAELGTRSLGGTTAPALTLYHLDPATSDSALGWTTEPPSASGVEYVALSGPSRLSDAFGSGGAVQLSVNGAVRQAQLYSGTSDLFSRASPSLLIQETGADSAIQLDASHTIPAKRRRLTLGSGGSLLEHDTFARMGIVDSLGVNNGGRVIVTGNDVEVTAQTNGIIKHTVTGTGRIQLAARPAWLPVGRVSDTSVSVGPYIPVTFIGGGTPGVTVAVGDILTFHATVRKQRNGAGGAGVVDVLYNINGGGYIALPCRIIVAELAVGEDATYHCVNRLVATIAGTYTARLLGSSTGGAFTAVAPDIWLAFDVDGIR